MPAIKKLFGALPLLALALTAVPAPCQTKVTGGGWFRGTPSGARGNFGFEVRDSLSGNLNYHDDGLGMHVVATSITSFTVVLANRIVRVQGTCTIDGVGGFTFTAELQDDGEPGRNIDTFTLTLSNGYNARGTVLGGNIQAHPTR